MSAVLYRKCARRNFIRRARNWLARLIATRDQVFSRDMSLLVDKLILENERLREQIGGST
jgi:hypothetical protein